MSLPAQGGAPASAPQQSSGESSGASKGGGAEGAHQKGGDVFDYKTAFNSQKKEIGETKSSLERTIRDFNVHKEKSTQDSDIISKIREAFNPREEAAEDPTGEWERQLDYYIAQGIDAQQKGGGIPLTVNLAVNLYKNLIAHHKEKGEWKNTLEELTGKVNQLSDPQQHINMRAYESMDTHIKRGLDSLYGPGNENLEAKRGLFKAIGGQLANVVNKMANDNPQQWDMVRRDPDALGELANRALRANIPPKALQMLAEDNLKNTEMPVSELMQAFREAKEIKDPGDRQRIMTQLRQEILERRFKPGSSQASGR